MVHPGFLLAKISVPTYDSGGGAKQAHHLRFKHGDFDWEAWAAAEGKPFVLKVTMTGRSEQVRFLRTRHSRGELEFPPLGRGARRHLGNAASLLAEPLDRTPL